MFSNKGSKILTLKTINQNILNTKYAVRGELAIRADEITKVKEASLAYFVFTFTLRNCRGENSFHLKRLHIATLAIHNN